MYLRRYDNTQGFTLHMDNKKFGAITSSIDPEEIATKVKGIVLGLSGVIIFLGATFFHITLSANDIITLATELSMVAGAVVFLYGIGMHILAHFFKQPTLTA